MLTSQTRQRHLTRAVLAILAASTLLLGVFASSTAAGASAASGGLGAFDGDWNPTIGGNGNPVPPSTLVRGARGVYAPSYLPACPYQHACVAVLDRQTAQYNEWRIWNLYHCGDYSVYDWHGRGWVRNNQSGGVRVVRMNSVYTALSPSHPVNDNWVDADWEPTYHIATCR